MITKKQVEVQYKYLFKSLVNIRNEVCVTLNASLIKLAERKTGTTAELA